LKALVPYYAGKVRCIYIDPPYNTGNENWIYNDAVNSPEMKAWLGKVVGKEAEDLSRHDKWLCMMYPRLQLLKRFLREDGAIFISIDDNEIANLRALIGDDHLAEDFFTEKFGPAPFGRSRLCFAVRPPRRPLAAALDEQGRTGKGTIQEP
jgi:adenine-specific DNA-methyltransferase